MSVLRSVPIKLSDSIDKETPLIELQLLKVGQFHHDRYGEFPITEKMLSEMVKNYHDNVRGVLPALDYSHDSEGVAAGWIKNLYLSENKKELWAKVEMTPKGLKTLSDKEFAYISAEFDQSYQTNEKPFKKVGATLLGAALTNRPVIKNMKSAIELAEGDMKMNEEQVKELMEKIEKMEASEKKLMEAAGVKSLEEVFNFFKKKEEDEKELSAKGKKLSEMEEENKKLSEKNSLLEKELKFSVMLSEGKVCAAQKKAFLSGDMEEFAKNAKVLNLSEKGHGNPAPKEEDPEDKILNLAKEIIKKDDTITLSEAISLVRKENPELMKL